MTTTADLRELIDDIEDYLYHGSVQDNLDYRHIHNICLNDEERYYDNPIIDDGVDGLRFSYYISRKQYCYNCLIVIENNDIVFKVITSDEDEVIYKEFKGIKDFWDIFDILTTRVYHLRWFYDENGVWTCEDTRPEKIQEQLEKDIKEIENELYDIETNILN